MHSPDQNLDTFLVLALGIAALLAALVVLLPAWLSRYMEAVVWCSRCREYTRWDHEQGGTTARCRECGQEQVIDL